ncbi:MAG: hypothetical protein ACRECM_04260 [Methyloceanibacter sp.]
MRFFIGAVALTVICAMFGSAAALVLGGVSLRLPRGDQVVSKAKANAPSDLGSRAEPNSLTVAKSTPSVVVKQIEQ